jgi:acetylornithine deacetylase/succinyl-diaminopimelate desuccinylase-like protein
MSPVRRLDRRGPPVRQVVRAYRSAHEREIVAELAAFVAIPNVASDSVGIRSSAAALVQMLEHRGLHPQRLESGVGGPPAVYAEWRVPGAKRTVVFYAHYDGQPVVASQWQDGPWTPVLRDISGGFPGRVIALDSPTPFNPEWRLYARSASDDKGSIVGILTAIDALRAAHRAPSANVKLFFEGEEEAGSPHLRDMLTRNAPLLAADAWLLCDGPIHQSRRMQVAFGVRGAMTMELTTYGPNRPLHSGHYGNWAPNPAVTLIQLLASMRDAEGQVLIPGFADDVVPIGATEQAAARDASGSDDSLERSLALGRTEGAPRPLGEQLLRPALNITGLRAGGVGAELVNAIPSVAQAAADFRLVPRQSPARIRDVVEAHIRAQGFFIVHDTPDSTTLTSHPKVIEVRWSDGYGGARTPLDEPFAQTTVATLRSAFPDMVLIPAFGGSLPIAPISDVLQVPFVIVPIANHDNNQHAANENLRLENLWDGIEAYAVLLAGLDWPSHRHEPSAHEPAAHDPSAAR